MPFPAGCYESHNDVPTKGNSPAMSSSTRSAPRAASLLLLLALVAGGCSDADPGETQPAPAPSSESSSPTSVPKPVSTKARIATVNGRLAKPNRRHALATATDLVDGWFDAAYVAGKYPRRDFGGAFPGFTAGARAQARRDRALMSNQDIGRRVDAVTATHRRVFVDVLAARGRAVGMTARFRLDFDTTGDLERRFQVQGRLLLTRTEDGWKVFAYDVTKAPRAKHVQTKPDQKKQSQKKHDPKSGKKSGKKKGDGR